MSVIIKGMEMPPRCNECPLSLYHHSPCWKNGGAVDWENRPAWCPIIELPPHGRLIDGDIAEIITADHEDGDFIDGILYAAEWIANQPTIIEAEEIK